MAVGPVSDNIVLPILVQVRDCLAAWFAAQSNPPAIVGLRWGADYAAMFSENADEACEGIVWVRFGARGDASGGFPATGGSPRPCPPALWSVTIEVGIARCAGQWTADGRQLPTQATWDALTVQLCDDMAAIEAALRCCPAVDKASWGEFQPLPIEGNATGATLTLSMPRTANLLCVEC